ncbi:hypothetical protein SAMN05421820_10257 [Pedobacter steynii]|uniref:Uncharacterized protein n=1 Tax=Pedobacter steynii TaxID=430522 RepID=A0A1G9MME5_9SPHI|nr:hypothetical protein [Pedobacter steynii]NQX39554.1 hypothetical protein [Pedobacter steynii]SDL75304.1 hypothetical protein SAMN05421820_10257 [Pedobacter steynii]
MLQFAQQIQKALSKSNIPAKGLISVQSDYGVKETVNRLVVAIASKEMTVFLRMDHAENAIKAGLHGLTDQRKGIKKNNGNRNDRLSKCGGKG